MQRAGQGAGKEAIFSKQYGTPVTESAAMGDAALNRRLVTLDPSGLVRSRDRGRACAGNDLDRSTLRSLALSRVVGNPPAIFVEWGRGGGTREYRR